jgi:acetolactate synthase-1/2/3 large subunit
LLINIQELATLAELQLPVKIVLFDNASLGMVRQQQQLFYRRRYFAAHFEKACDFVAIARAFGIHALDLDCNGDIAAQLAPVFASSGPALIRVAIDGHHNVSPMVGPGAANIEALDCY